MLLNLAFKERGEAGRSLFVDSLWPSLKLGVCGVTGEDLQELQYG